MSLKASEAENLWELSLQRLTLSWPSSKFLKQDCQNWQWPCLRTMADAAMASGVWDCQVQITLFYNIPWSIFVLFRDHPPRKSNANHCPWSQIDKAPPHSTQKLSVFEAFILLDREFGDSPVHFQHPSNGNLQAGFLGCRLWGWAPWRCLSFFSLFFSCTALVARVSTLYSDFGLGPFIIPPPPPKKLGIPSCLNYKLIKKKRGGILNIFYVSWFVFQLIERVKLRFEFMFFLLEIDFSWLLSLLCQNHQCQQEPDDSPPCYVIKWKGM